MFAVLKKNTCIFVALLTLKTKHVQIKKKPSVNEILMIFIKIATDVTCTLADMILQSFVDKKINTFSSCQVLYPKI